MIIGFPIFKWRLPEDIVANRGQGTTARKTEQRKKKQSTAAYLGFGVLIYLLFSLEIGSWLQTFVNNIPFDYIASFGSVALAFYFGLSFVFPKEIMSFEIQITHFLSNRGLIEIRPFDEPELKAREISKRESKN